MTQELVRALVDAKAVFKASMYSTRVDEVSGAKLSNCTQALECGVVDDLEHSGRQ